MGGGDVPSELRMKTKVEAITHMAKAEPSKGFELLGKHRLLLGESREVMKSSCLV